MTAPALDLTDPLVLKQWRQELMAFRLREILAAEAAQFTEATRFGEVRDRLRDIINSNSLRRATMCLADLYAAVYGERRGNRMMFLIKHYGAIANTLAEDSLVSSQPGDLLYALEKRHSLLYSTGILLEDMLVEIEALGELPEDLVNRMRHYLNACEFTARDFSILEPLLICETEGEFMEQLGMLLEDFREQRNLWELLKVVRGRKVMPHPPARLALPGNSKAA